MVEPYCMSWDEVYARIAGWNLTPGARVFGIPRGGAVVAGLTGMAVDRLEDATVLVDDIVDTGATLANWQRRPGCPGACVFRCLVDKTGPDRDLPWVVFPWEGSVETSAHDIVTRTLEYIGEDPKREGLRETPARVARSWGELYAGYRQDPAEVMKVFEDGACDEMVVCKDIDFVSTCEHHMLPFFGQVHIGYIPNGRLVGLSKLARVTEVYARRLQVQERMTTQIADALDRCLRPQGVVVVCEGRHLCMIARGVLKPNAVMQTSALRGSFKTDQVTRDEFLTLIGR